MAQPIVFEPLYMERVWGGRGLETKLNRDLPAGQVIGESWELVDRPEAQSVVKNGPHAGLTIRQLLQKQGQAIMGPGYDGSRPFPILVKWLDCQERLSLQVHPPEQVAGKLGGEPKTENWYIAEVDEGAELLVGLKQGATREAFESALKNNNLEPLVHKVEVQAGDSIFVWSGRIHAIGGGNLILEIQQNSDTTYRVYDWGRVGLDGKPRDLHVEESMESIAFDDFEPEPLRNTQAGDVLADCKEFRIRKEKVTHRNPLTIADNESPLIINVLSGEIYIAGEESVSVTKGDTILLPYEGSFEISSTDAADVLITDRFI